MPYRILILLGFLLAAVLWVGLGWQVLRGDHLIPYDPPQRCLHAALPVLPGHSVMQTLRGRSHGLSGVSLAFRTTAAARVALQVHEVGADGRADPLAGAVVQLPANHPFYTVNVVFPPQSLSESRTYAVLVRASSEEGESEGGRGSAPFVWSCWSDSFAFGELRVDGDPAHGDLIMQPLYQRGAGGAVQAIAARFQGLRVGVIPAWLWWLSLAVVLLGTPTLVVRAAGGRVGSLAHLVAVLVLLPLVGLAVYWGDPRLHRPVVQAGEVPPGTEAPAPTRFDLLNELRKQAVGEIAPRQTWDRHLTFALEPVTRDDGERALALHTSVNTVVTWRHLTIPPNAGLSLAAAVDQGQWSASDGPVEVRVSVTANGATLLDVQETLMTATGEPHRLTQTLDLSAHAGQSLTLTLTTLGETRNSARMVVWSGLRLD